MLHSFRHSCTSALGLFIIELFAVIINYGFLDFNRFVVNTHKLMNINWLLVGYNGEAKVL